MSTQSVTSKIIENAKLASAQTLDNAKKEAEEKRSEIINLALQRAENIKSNAEKDAEILKKGRKQADKMNAKLALLNVKREILGEVKKKAKSIAVNDDSFAEIFSLKIKESSLSGEYILKPSALHRSSCKKALGAFEKAADIKLTLSKENADIENGFILSCESYDVEFSLDEITDEIFDNSEKEIAQILFDGVN